MEKIFNALSCETGTGAKRAIITVVGLDQVGIIAHVTKTLAENGVNVLDISQTILGEFFTMIMSVDFSKSPIEFTVLRERLSEAGKKMGLDIHIQHEDVFRYMHRI